MAGIRAEVVLSVNDTQAKRSMERSAAELNRIMGGVGKQQVNFKVNSRSFTQPLGRITGSANEFTKSLEASNARVIAFGASVGIINGISDAFKNLVAETVRFEKTLADVNVVLDASNASLQRFGQGLFDVAKNTSQSFGVAAEAALEFSRQGLTMEEVLKRTNDALTLTRLTGLKAAEAVSGLTAAVNAFSSVGLTTTQVIDKLAAVDVKFAVSSEDLINALERTGAVAIDAGVELDSLIGLVTSLQQTTARGGAVIGNGLKTIFTRIQRPKSLEQIEALDIAVRNLSGAVLPADRILINIAKSFDTLTSSQKSNVVQFSAGIFQANVFRAALRDLGKTQSIQARATEVSAGAAGEAAMKNQKLNKTIAALASQSGSAVQELASAMGDLMVKPEIGGFLEFFKSSIEGMSDMLGGGEEQGSTFAKGLVAGIGNIITGPAVIAFGAVFIKLFMNIAKFASGSLKDVLDIVTRKDKIRKIEESILETLSKNKDIQVSLNNLEGDREAQGQFILKIIEAQTNAMRQQEKLAARLARPLLDAGVKTDLTVGGHGPVDLDGDGQIDSFGARGVLPSSAKRERREASRGGYSAGAVDSMSMPGVGKVVYNKAEEVKQFPGMKQPAIMPPKRSRAGGRYKDAFSKKHGFDPYAAKGLVPNFIGDPVMDTFNIVKEDLAHALRLGDPGAAKMVLQMAKSSVGASPGSSGVLKIIDNLLMQLSNASGSELSSMFGGKNDDQVLSQLAGMGKKGRKRDRVLNNAGGFIPNFAELYKTINFSTADYSIFYKTPLDVVDRTLGTMGKMTPETKKNHGLRNRRSNQQRLLEAGHSPEQLFAEDYPITSHNIEDGILQDLLRGDVTALRGSDRFKDFVKSADTLNMRRYGGRKSTTEEWLKTAPPLATDLGNAYEIPSKAFEARLEGQTWPIGEFHHLAGLKPGKSYDSKKFMSNINAVRDFKGMAEGLVNSGDTSNDWMGKSLGQQRGLLSTRGQGLIPNFATISGDALRLNQSKMHLYANPREAKPGGDAVRNAMKALVDSGKPVTVRAATDKLLKGEGGSHTKAIKSVIRFIADQKNGPKLFERDFKLTNLPWKGNKGEDASEDAVAKLLNKDGKKYINTGKRPGAHGDKTFPVDLIGEGLDPVEIKSGEWKQPNILLKSMRLYSDDELMQFAERQYGATPEMLKGARMEKLGKSARLLQGKGLLDKDASLEEQHNAAMKYGIAGGFVPNFAGKSKADWIAAVEELYDYVSKGGELSSSEAAKIIGESDQTISKQILGKTPAGRSAPGAGSMSTKLEAHFAGGNKLSTVQAAIKAGGIAPSVPQTHSFMPNSIKWEHKEDRPEEATLDQIAAHAGGKSLQGNAGNLNPGMAFADTQITTSGANAKIKSWGGMKRLMSTLNPNFSLDISRYVPYQDNGGKGPKTYLTKTDLESGGISDGTIFENFIKGSAKSLAGTLTADKAPLDFLNKDAEAKLVGYTSAGRNFNWPEIVGKALRSKIGNNLSNFKAPSDFRNSFVHGGLSPINLFQAASQGLIPNFAGEAASGRAYEGDTISKYTNLYRGTSPKYQKAVPDRPNAPQFLFDKLLNAQTKIGFLSAVEELGTQHAKGKYSGSYNTDLKPATLEQMRGGEELGAGEVQHAGYVYKRPIKGQKKRTMPSGFVSKSKSRSVADRFSRALEFKHQGSHDQQGQIHEDKIPNNRILNREAIEKLVDYIGLQRVQKGFKRMMKEGTLNDLYIDLDKWRDKTAEGEERSSWDNTHKYRSIGHSGEGMTFDEEEVVQIWGKHSPYYGAAKGLIPNFVRWLPNPKGGPPIPAPDLDPVDGKPRSIYSGADVKEMRSKGYAYSDSKGWHYKGQAKGIGLAQTENNIKYMSGVAEPVSIRYLNSIKEFDRSKKSFLGWGQPGGDDRFSNLEELGSDMIKREVENALIIGYDSQQNMLQLIEGNHRLAAINEKNVAGEDNYNTLPAYVSGTSIRGGNYGDGADYSKGITNRKGEPSRLPADVRAILEEQRERSSEMEGRGLKPAFGMNRIIQGRWKPSEFGIPNFADNRSRQQKISDVLGDPSNAGINFQGGILKPRSIKSKNMFQKMWLESYFKTGLEGDYQMLMKMGYDPDTLLSLRSHAKEGGEVDILGKGFVPNFLNSNAPSQPGVTQGLKNNDRAAGRVDSLKGKFMEWIKSRVNSLSTAEKAALMGAQLIPGGSMASGSYLLVKELWKKWQDEDITRPSELNGLGLVPNFANPLREAIAREEAAGIPKSQIKVEQSGQLRGPGNPMGLAVTNKRDEPLGIGQGIRRARSMGMDPKRHGAGSGFIPSFADDEVIPAALVAHLDEEVNKITKLLEEDFNNALKASIAALEDFGSTPFNDKQLEKLKTVGDEKSIKELDFLADNVEKTLRDEKAKPQDQQDPEWADKLQKYLEEIKKLNTTIKAKEGGPEATSKKVVADSEEGTLKASQARKLEAQMIKKLAVAKNSTERKALQDTIKDLQGFQQAIQQSSETVEEESNERGGGLQKLFYMQSAISMLNGFLEQFSEGARGATKTFLDLATAASNVTAAYIQQKELVGEGMNLAGVGENEKGYSLGMLVNSGQREEARSQAAATEATIAGQNALAPGGGPGRLMGSLGRVGRMFGRFLPVVGQLYTGFTMANEAVKFVTKNFKGLIPGLEAGEGIMDLFASASDRATKRMKELSETADSLKAALGGLETQEKEQIELRKLENKGTSRTIAEEKKYYDLRLKSIDTDIALSKAMGSLMDENKTGRRSLERINRVINTTTMSMSEQRDGIRDLIIANQMLMAATSQRAGFQEGIDRADSDDDSQRLFALAETRGVQMALAMGAAFEGKKGASDTEKIAALGHNIEELTKAMNFQYRDASGGLEGLNFNTTEAIGTTGITEMLRGAIQDIDEFTYDLGGLAPDEQVAYRKTLQELINMLKKRKDAQSKGLKDDVDMNIASQKALEIAQFDIEQRRKNTKHFHSMFVAEELHRSKLLNIQKGIEKEYEGISSEAHIELQAATAANDRRTKYEHDIAEARRSSIEALDKIVGESLTDPGSLSGDIMTDVKNASKKEVKDKLAEFEKRLGTGANWMGPLAVAGQSATDRERRHVTEAFAQALAESQGGNALDKLTAMMNARATLKDSPRESAMFAILASDLEIVDQKEKKILLLEKELMEHARVLQKIEQEADLADELAEKEKIKNLIAEKTIQGAQELFKILIGTKNEAETRNKLSGVINETLQGQADTLAVINKYQKDRASIINGNLDFDRKAFETQKEKNRNEMESGLLALRQLEYQQESLEGLEESAIIQEAKLKSEMLTAGQSAKEAELRYKFLSDLTNRSSLIKEQIGAEMSGLRTAKMMNRDKLKQQIIGGELDEMAERELREQETSLSTEALKNAQLAANLSHLREAGSLSYMANRLQEKSNKLIEAQNASRQAVLSRGDLAFSTKADLITERSGAIGETRATAMRALMTNSPEDALAFASSLEATNKQLDIGSRAVDRLRVRMAELDVSAKNLGADLVELGFDGVRTGFKQLLDDIGSGAKSTGDAWRDFGLGLAKTLLDRITEHNIDRIVKDLTYAFTGVDPMSEAEKIASSNNHLVSANDKLIAALKALETEVARDKKGLEGKVGKSESPDTPFDGKIEDKTAIELLKIKSEVAILRAQIASINALNNQATANTVRGPVKSLSARHILGSNAMNALWVQTSGGFYQGGATGGGASTGGGPPTAQDILTSSGPRKNLIGVTTADVKVATSDLVESAFSTANPKVAEGFSALADLETKAKAAHIEWFPPVRTTEDGQETVERVKYGTTTRSDVAYVKKEAALMLAKDQKKLGFEGAFLRDPGGYNPGVKSPFALQKGIDITSPQNMADFRQAAPEHILAVKADLAVATAERDRLKALAFEETKDKGAFDFRVEQGKKHPGSNLMADTAFAAAKEVEVLTGRIKIFEEALAAVNSLPLEREKVKVLKEVIERPVLNAPVESPSVAVPRPPFELLAEKQTVPEEAPPEPISSKNWWEKKVETGPTKKELNDLITAAGIDPEEAWKENQANQKPRGLRDGPDFLTWGTAMDDKAKGQEAAMKNIDNIIADVRETTVTTPTAEIDAGSVSLNVGALTITPWSPTPTATDKQGGGIIQHFADGGFVKGPGGKDKVPAMLTAGEFVLPKKDVNNAFNFMGQNVRGRGDAIEGMRKNQSIHSQSQEVRDIRAAEGGRYVQKFNDGTGKDGAQEKKGRTQRGIEGGLQAWAMVETAQAMNKALNKDVDKPPTFNMKKLDSLDLGSDVNLKRGDPRLSAKFLAKDPVMQEYRDYLIEAANYKTQKINEEFREDMGVVSSIFGAVTSFVTAELVAIAKPYIEKGITATKNWAGETFGKYGDDYSAAKNMAAMSGEKLNYSDFKKSYKGFKKQGKEGFFNIGDNLHLMDNGAVFDMSASDTFAVAAGDPALSRKMASFYATGPTGGTPQMKDFVSAQTDIVNSRIGGPGDWLKWGSRKADDFGLGNIFTHRSSAGCQGSDCAQRQGGGSIPAMLTAGEGYIPEPIAKRIGYNNLSHMNNTGTMPIVKGTGGVDNVGPVGLNSGDFIMKKSSTNKLLRDNPNAMRFSLQGQSDGRRGAQGYYEGGIVGSELTVPARSLGPQKSQQGNRLQLLDQKEGEKSDSGTAGSTTNAETTNNININISIDKAGAEVESQEGGEDSYEKERNLSMKIKGAVLEVIREEKRIGGELS